MQPNIANIPYYDYQYYDDDDNMITYDFGLALRSI